MDSDGNCKNFNQFLAKSHLNMKIHRNLKKESNRIPTQYFPLKKCVLQSPSDSIFILNYGVWILEVQKYKNSRKSQEITNIYKKKKKKLKSCDSGSRDFRHTRASRLQL